MAIDLKGIIHHTSDRVGKCLPTEPPSARGKMIVPYVRKIQNGSIQSEYWEAFSIGNEGSANVVADLPAQSVGLLRNICYRPRKFSRDQPRNIKKSDMCKWEGAPFHCYM